MALEMELKYLDVDLIDLANRLAEAGGESTGPYFERNLVFDYPDRSLKTVGTLLRLREKQGQAVLTVKRKPDGPVDSVLKVFEEIESGVDDFEAVKESLETIGLKIAFGYEKVRNKWTFMDCVICLDKLPFGDYVEIEGTEKTVFSCAKALGLAHAKTTKLTYHALNLEFRNENGLEPDESFLFSKDDRAMIVEQLKKD